MTPSLDSSVRLSMLESMMLIRAHEEQLAALATPTSPATCTAVGQEAAAVGVVRALQPRDRILADHRSGRPPAGARRRPRPRDGRSDRTEHRLLQGQERLAAHQREGAGRGAQSACASRTAQPTCRGTGGVAWSGCMHE